MIQSSDNFRQEPGPLREADQVVKRLGAAVERELAPAETVSIHLGPVNVIAERLTIKP